MVRNNKILGKIGAFMKQVLIELIDFNGNDNIAGLRP